MKTNEVNNSVIGKQVEFMCRGFKATGTIINTIEDRYSKGVRIQLTSDVYDGYERVNFCNSTSRKIDDFGNLSTVKFM